MTEIKTEIFCEDVTQKSIVKVKGIVHAKNDYGLHLSSKSLEKIPGKSQLQKDS